MSHRLLIPVVTLALFGCAGSKSAQKDTQDAEAASKEDFTAYEETASRPGDDRPFFTAEDARALHRVFWENPDLASRVVTDEERKDVIDCVTAGMRKAIPTFGEANTLGEERVNAIGQEVGNGCLVAHRERVLSGPAWTASFAPIYTEVCAQNAPEPACACVGEKAQEHFDSPAAFHALDQLLSEGQKPTQDQAQRFESLMSACGLKES